MRLLQLILSSILISTAHCLTCYICGDANLDEFGECSTQFQYDCGTYAERFSNDERIYCRTTRQKTKNNTYTIMKECISETDHYKTFPEKGYRLDAECDLVDVNKHEVAYCLCRDDYCNRNSIADQFMAFEEKHPELFGDADEAPANPEPFTVPPGIAPLKIQSLPASAPASAPVPPAKTFLTGPQPSPTSFAAPILNPPAIVPINSKSSGLIEIRRTQLPTRETTNIESEISASARVGKPQSSSKELPGIMNLPRNAISEGTFVGSGSPVIAVPSMEIKPEPPVQPQQIPQQPEQFQSRPQSRPIIQAAVTSHSMQCIQCGDGSLTSETDECKQQLRIDCQTKSALCFTRQIALERGQYGVEKMCVTPEQLISEFGLTSQLEGCGTSNGGRVKYCACSSPLCNQLSIQQQQQIFNEINSAVNGVHHNAAIPAAPSTTSTTSTTTTTTTTTTPLPITTTTAFLNNHTPIIPIINRPSSYNSIHCVTCAQSDINDPTSDCTRSSEETCDPYAKYCVTKQTQMSETSFAMEKKCLSENDAKIFLPGEKLEEGCATSEGGMVNYCICKGNLCNRASLLQQAQMIGVHDSLEEQRTIEEQLQKQEQKTIQTPHLPTHQNVGLITNRVDNSRIEVGANSKLPPVFLEEEDSHEIAKDIRSEEDIIKARQNEWAKMNVNGVSRIGHQQLSVFVFSCLSTVLLAFAFL